MLDRLNDEPDPMTAALDWLSRLLEIMPVRGSLDLRCHYGAPWRIDQPASAPREIPYHVVLSGSAVLEDPAGGAPQRLSAGDILLFPNGSAHVLRDGSDLAPAPARERPGLNLVFSENDRDGDALDMLCGRFILDAHHERLLSGYLPPRLILRTAQAGSETAAQVAGLVELMRIESAAEALGGHAMLGGLSTAMFALVLRLASEAGEQPPGLLALARHPHLGPALTAMFRQPERSWSLPELASLCHMSRATLARKFQEALGRSASDLLLDIRMTLAAQALRRSSASTGAVAESVGYQSEAAFQRAFKQVVGMTPAQWRKAAA